MIYYQLYGAGIHFNEFAIETMHLIDFLITLC